jgi:hypothetical protein
MVAILELERTARTNALPINKPVILEIIVEYFQTNNY